MLGADLPPEPWTLSARSEPRARQRLLCLPFAGGGASAYRSWGAELAKSGIEVWPVQLPGRENRLKEPAMDDLPALAALLADVFGAYLPRRPYALFGHSMGASIAFEFVREVRRRGLPEPVRLIVSANRPPHRPDPAPPTHSLPRAELITKLRSYGGTPRELFDEPDLVDLLLPTMRADFALFERFQWVAEEPLGCPVTVLGGLSDVSVPDAELYAWEALTTGPFHVRMLPGDHFFLLKARNMTIETVRELLSGR
ncbi:thioesterase [Acrocarpospora corrugata]|uniref:Thioesterase n=1 Tax=Acrocarpospora corrugata TaxID=35763 RepID=A0A5M3W4E2_9ACTN|nr:alpha/beta fold hydrolase [Acrocarpospora corrugata]GES03169.1 thioesterase [Acrocarpospora corrugata]